MLLLRSQIIYCGDYLKGTTISYLLFITLSIITITGCIEDNQQKNYSDLEYYFTIDVNNNDTYQLFIPIPSDGSNGISPIVTNLTLKGEIETNIRIVTTPYGESFALEIIGKGDAQVLYDERIINDKENYSSWWKYQISNLYLSKDLDALLFYFNSTQNSCNVNFHTKYVSFSEGDKWEAFWRLDSETELSNGWNEVEVTEYHDGDI